MNGVLLIDKPGGMTSHDVVDRVRRVVGVRRVGHAGTLDPLATGLLVICVGRATRIVQFLTGLTKEYTGVIRLGACSSTYDAEGEIVPQDKDVPESAGVVETAMHAQRGLRTQLAPPYSAVKVKGKKLYEYARQGIEVPEKHRRVQIQRFDLVDFEGRDVKFRAKVGSGTYVRSMAHDLGAQLGCGAYLLELRREKVGAFDVESATPLAELIRQPELVEFKMLSIPEALVHLPKITIMPEMEGAVLNGRSFTTRDILISEALPKEDEPSLVVNREGEALSIVSGEPLEGGDDEPDLIPKPLKFRPLRVLGRSEAA